MREQQKANNQAPRYDNRHRNLTEAQRAEFEAQGRKPVIRFKIDDAQQIVWQDLIRGTMTWKGSDLGGDMVIARTPEGDESFGQPLYNLAVVVDDIDMQISHVIRGKTTSLIPLNKFFYMKPSARQYLSLPTHP